MKWVTRANVKVDRVACPWLIRTFIDRDAEFSFRLARSSACHAQPAPSRTTLPT